MTTRRALCVAAMVAAAIPAALRSPAHADPPPGPAPSPSGEAPDESLLGTVEVNGSAGLPPLPKMAVVPVLPTGTADSVVNLVIRRDLELSGQFDVLRDDVAPSGTFTHSTPIDLGAWKATGAEYVVRDFAEPTPNDSAGTQLVGEAFLTPGGAKAAEAPAGGAKPAFRTVLPTPTTEVRAASHRLADQILGALTGRPGGFSSSMVYAQKVGRWRRVFAIDADGFDLRPIGP